MAKRIILAAVSILLVTFAGYASFYVAPTERTMGLIQRIFYFHVSSAWAGMDVLIVCFIGNLLYVWKRDTKFDALSVACAEVGLVFMTVVLITGPIWGHPVWGIWWTWDARLTSTFVLWLLYVSYLLLRTLVEEPERRALLSSLFGIFAFIDVPLVWFSIRWWRTQHPSAVFMGGPNSGLADPTMKKVFFFCVLAMHFFALFLVLERYALEKLKHEVDILKRELEVA
jgi:heme exporter protein C